MDGVVEGQASDFQTLNFDDAWKALRQVDIVVTYGPFSIAGFSIDNIHVEHALWEAAQFRSSDPVITFETGSTALYPIPGVHFGGGGATPSRNAFGSQLFGNISSAEGFSILNVYFDEPKQAVGGHLINVNIGYLQGVYGVKLVVYDEHDIELQSASKDLTIWNDPVPFLGLGSDKTNIFRAEWQYIGNGGFYGVDNLVYTPAHAIVMSETRKFDDAFSFSFQSVPGHTNIVHQKSPITGVWQPIVEFLGDGRINTITVSSTNSEPTLFRINVP